MENKIQRLDNYSTIDSYKTYFNMFIFTVIFSLIYNLIISILISAGGLSAETIDSNPIIMYAQCFVSPLMFFSLFLWQNRGKKYNIKQILGVNKKISYKTVLLSIIVAIFCLFLFSNIATLFNYSLKFIGFNPPDEINLLKDNFGHLLLNIFVLALLPAVFEELIFRGIVFKGLITDHKPIVAILLTTFMFTFMHGTLQQTFYQLILGLVITLIMYVTDNILYPIIVHFCNNAIVIIVDYITYHQEVAGTFATDFFSIVNYFLLAFVGVVLFYLIFDKLIKNNKATTTTTTEFKSFKKYSLREKEYCVLSLSLAVVIWVITTITILVQG